MQAAAEQYDQKPMAPPSLQISPREEQRLSDFFCSQNASACRSNFGAMVERIDMYGHAAERCAADGCEGGIDLRSGQLCTECKGRALAPPEKLPERRQVDDITATVPCRWCQGRTGDESCSACGGDGYVEASLPCGPPVTCGGGYEPDLDQVRSAGRIIAGLDRLRCVDERLAVTLELYYGPIGNLWGAGGPNGSEEKGPGRAFAVWPITKPGRRLIDESRKRSESLHTLEIPAHALLNDEREAEKRAPHPNEHRRALLGAAEKAAEHLIDRAKKAWVLLQSELGGRNG